MGGAAVGGLRGFMGGGLWGGAYGGGRGATEGRLWASMCVCGGGSFMAVPPPHISLFWGSPTNITSLWGSPP